jgi:hypothetical protein
MTPKEKAKELTDKYWIYLRAGLLYDEEAKEDAKHCALIAVNEIIDSIVIIDLTAAENQFTYWEQVKTEIEKL